MKEEVNLIKPSSIRYIKLGRGGVFASDGIDKGRLNFGYHSIDHKLCLANDWGGVAAQLGSSRKSQGALANGVRELRDFYTLDDNCLWVTFADKHLYWAFAEPKVHFVSTVPDAPSRYRQTIDGWKKTDIRLNPLRMSALSSRLTQLAAYRATICSVKDEDYLLRQINCRPDPLIVEARQAQERLFDSAERLIKGLHWSDFEILADLIFARSGWIRSTQVGEGLADIDMILEQTTIRERAFVQVKSRASQSVLDDYRLRFVESGCDRFFFVCHSPKGNLSLTGPNEHLFTGRTLAVTAVQNGLFQWLIERSG
ncbi:restriction endonuclease [Rhizobium sp. YTU87027]|uniref:restriction endonuclease n=1 Tax=Rhizobium sp. YTU87027 TaxID=3417741 RepID=UPI003D69C2DE